MFWYGNSTKTFGSPVRVAVIPGDGVGPEVIHADMSVLDAVQRLDPTLDMVFGVLPWGTAYYRGSIVP